MKKVAVIMGSDSDWPVVKGACAQLEAFGIPYEAHILSAHRTPRRRRRLRQKRPQQRLRRAHLRRRHGRPPGGGLCG